MSSEFLAERRRALEESFFRRRNAELLEDIRKQLELEARRHELATVSGIRDEKLLDRLLRLELHPDTVAALSLVPMVRVAWADGSLDPKELDTILQSAVDAGVARESASYHWLKTWLQAELDAELIEAWQSYVAALTATLDAEDREELQRGLLSGAERVAKAAGGVLGLGNKISAEEQQVLDELAEAFKVS